MPVLSELQAVTGSEFVSEAADGITISPGSTQETSSVLQICAAHRLKVATLGSCTKSGWGTPIKTDVQLLTRRLTGIREHVWQDMTAAVGAGTRWNDMQNAFADHRQQVALDPLFPSNATVGGTLAVNDSGALRTKFGSLRDFVIGMTIVLADGTIARSGGKVVKNVAGYDLPKLLIGSYGTLGVITEVNFRLHPLDSDTESWSISGEISALAELMQQLKSSPTSLQSLQLRSDAGNASLDVRFASSPAALDQAAAQLASLTSSLELQPAAENVWGAREQLFSDSTAAVLKVTCLPTQIAAVVTGFDTSGAKGSCVAEAVGIITVRLQGEPDLFAALIEDLRARLRATGGMVVVLQWPFPFTPLDRWGGSPPAIAVMRELKQQFDPERLLNPGKFVGGI